MPVNPVLGQIMPFAGQVVPRGWALCNGALVGISQNQALFSLLGTYYGGNGTTTFGLPDLRGRAVLGASGAGSGNYPLGSLAGTTMVTLSVPQLPSHNHIIQASTKNGAGRGQGPANNLFCVNTEPAANPKKIFLLTGSGETPLAISTNIVNDGGSQAHNNLQPYLTISYLIALSGTYPSRN